MLNNQPNSNQNTCSTYHFHVFSPESGVAAEVVAAVDVNTTANEIYKHNFPSTLLRPKTIEVSLTPDPTHADII